MDDHAIPAKKGHNRDGGRILSLSDHATLFLRAGYCVHGSYLPHYAPPQLTEVTSV
jgi:hypothetical protein